METLAKIARVMIEPRTNVDALIQNMNTAASRRAEALKRPLGQTKRSVQHPWRRADYLWPKFERD